MSPALSADAQPMPSGPTIVHDINRGDPAVVERARALPSARLHEAGGRIGVMPPAIKPVAASFRICGTAVTVQGPAGDNLWIHRAIYVAQPGDVLVVHVSDGHDWGYWGEIMSTAARVRGLAGLVIDGCVRDGAVLIDEAVSVEQLREQVHTAASSLLREVVVFDVYRGPGIESGRKSVALGLILQDKKRTLTDEDTDRVIASVRKALSQGLGAGFRE